MSDLQKIVVLCIVVGAVVLGIYIGSQYDIVPAGTQTSPEVVDQESSRKDDSPGNNVQPPSEPTKSVDTRITTFEECVAAGNPVMESYPRQCQAEGELFVEVITDTPDTTESTPGIICTEAQKKAEACTMEYMPVCGLVQVQCFTEPCDPIPETFGNACSACAQGNVISYTEGECE